MMPPAAPTATAAVGLEQNERAVDDEEEAEPTGERAGRQSLQQPKADRHADETASDVGQRPFALGLGQEDRAAASRTFCTALPISCPPKYPISTAATSSRS